MRKVVLGFILSFVLLMNANAQNAVLRGTVTDLKTGETIVGASVFLGGTTIGVMSDFDGKFELKNISPGSYTLKCSFISYEPQAKEVVLSANDELNIDFKLGEAVVQVEEVTVVARANRENETLLLMEQKESEGIKESIGAQRLSSLGVSDAATAASKISGVTKNEGSGDVYIRGLGDRYLSTTMNGLPIPSDDVAKKNIELNLFSTDVIKNVGISKTYSVVGYGDQSSGQVDIASKTFTDKTEVEISAGTGTNMFQNDVFGNFRTTQNMSNTTLGFFDGPGSLESAVKNESWNTLDYNFPLNRGFSILGGKQFNLPNNDELTVFATLSHDYSFNHNEGVYKKYRGYVLDRSFTDAENYKTSINTTGLLNVNYKINDDNNINLNTLFVNKTTDELYEQGRNGKGYYYDQIPQDTATFMRDQNIKQTTMLVNQLLGTHELSDKNTLKWAVGANFVSADEPNRIRNKVIMLEEDKVFFVRRTYFEQSKSYQKINDFEGNGFVNDQIRFVDEEKRKLKVDYGVNFRFKTRDFNSLKRAVTTRETATSIDNLDAVLNNQELYELGLIDYQDQAKEDTYNAILGVAAGYINAGFKSDKFSGNIGLRYEFDMLDVEWDVTNYLGRTGSLNNPYHNFLPALNLKYDLNANNALRFAASKTITLPEFKELAPFEYVSPTGQVTKGNPDLQKSVDYNLDLKWEMFPTNKELISVTGFYKLINDPINLAQTRGSSGNFFYANTGEKANVYGVEVETRLGIIKAEQTGKPDLNLALNATKMWFNQDLLENYQYNNKTEVDLQGAAGFIFNGSLVYSTNTEKEFKATLTGNYSSDKILALGAPESQTNSDIYFNNEIIEKGFTTLDMVVSKKLSKRVTVKLTGKNLLNPNIKQTKAIKPPSEPESTVTVRSYKKGISLKLGVKINLN
jgi:outer membrane receptor protein involved in Fe transport